jgi:hypothetical protein
MIASVAPDERASFVAFDMLDRADENEVIATRKRLLQ